jgi:hypothetical protein
VGEVSVMGDAPGYFAKLHLLVIQNVQSTLGSDAGHLLDLSGSSRCSRASSPR